MKKLLLILIGFYVPVFLFSQAGTSVTYRDAGGTLTLTYNNMVNGKHSYRNASENITLSYNGSRWEITYGATVLYYSNASTATNPPNRAIGNWQNQGAFGGLLQLNGDGTTSMLPVKLIGFHVDNSNSTVILKWSTLTEMNNDKFEIQASTDGIQFMTIGEVQGQGSNLHRQDYSFELLGNTGIWYYRLKQIDYDATYAYSNIVRYEHRTATKGNLFPNPCSTGFVFVELESYEENTAIRVFDVMGKLKLQTIATFDTDARIGIDLTGFEAGVYFISVGSGLHSVPQRLVLTK